MHQEFSKFAKETINKTVSKNRYAVKIYERVIQKLDELFFKRREFGYQREAGSYEVSDDSVSEDFFHLITVNYAGTNDTAFKIHINPVGKVDVNFWSEDDKHIEDSFPFDYKTPDLDDVEANVLVMMAVLDRETFGHVYKLLSDPELGRLNIESVNFQR